MFRWEICFIWHSCFVFIVQVNTQGLAGINVLRFSVVYTLQNESQVHLWMLTCGAFSFCLHEGKVSLKYDGGATDRRVVKRVKRTQWFVFFAGYRSLFATTQEGDSPHRTRLRHIAAIMQKACGISRLTWMQMSGAERRARRRMVPIISCSEERGSRVSAE